MSIVFLWNKPHSHIQAWCRSQASWFWQECTSAICQEELINRLFPSFFQHTACVFLPLLVWFICKASLTFPPTATPSVLACLGFHRFVLCGHAWVLCQWYKLNHFPVLSSMVLIFLGFVLLPFSIVCSAIRWGIQKDPWLRLYYVCSSGRKTRMDQCVCHLLRAY